jgi:oligopeptide/dipeptide ABC transporter ATP-binding protein
MRQRMMIAMALACEPSLVLADEPTTALDVTIQAQILELMKSLSRRLGVAMLMITHNLGVVARYADRVNVMYAGKIIERGTAREIYANPKHPYTLGLLRSVPRLDEPRRARLAPIEGQPPDLTRLPPGCAFAPRCAFRVERCAREVPRLEPVGNGEHVSACWESARLQREYEPAR